MRTAKCSTLGIAAVLGVVALLSEAAGGQPPETERIGWSAGAGAIFDYHTDPAYGGVLLLEKQLRDRLLLTFHGQAHYRRGEGGAYVFVFPGWSKKTEKSRLAAVGLRWVFFNPGGTLQGSVTAQIRASVSRVKQVTTDHRAGLKKTWRRRIKSTSKFLGLDLGVAFEKELASNLYLRFEGRIVRVAWGRVRQRHDFWGMDGTHHHFITRPGGHEKFCYVFHPALLLRLAI